ncbi:MAG: flavin reductase family protein [Spirochaetes bacterium]|nr:flavin reductase family protein [Spirochaetota bacterium]
MDYREYSKAEAYKLQNAGGLVMICTRGVGGRYNLAPIAWSCPIDYAPVSRFVCVLDTGHQTFTDLSASREFAMALPRPSQKDLILQCGSVSGAAADKYEAFSIPYFGANRIDVRLPQGITGWIECSVSRVIVEGTSALVLGDVLYAAAIEGFWKERFHYVDEGTSFAPGAEV